MNLQQVFDNNKEWVKSKLKADNHYFENLAKGQNPEILYIGCSDSRETAEEMMGVGQGEAFVHRNIANMIPNTDLNVMSVRGIAIHGWVFDIQSGRLIDLKIDFRKVLEGTTEIYKLE